MKNNKSEISPTQGGSVGQAERLSAATASAKQTENRVGESEPLAAAPCSALSGSFWESIWGELPESCKTPDGKVKMKLNQNNPMILKGPDGHLVQLSPDNAAHLIPSAQIEFYQGEAVSPETCRQVWDEARRYHHLSDGSESVQSSASL